jgi:hypothetical protein
VLFAPWMRKINRPGKATGKATGKAPKDRTSVA